MQSDLDTLKRKVLEAAKLSGLAARVEDVAVEPDQDDEGTGFLRVIVRVTGVCDSDETAFEHLLEEIENAVATVDERYPSVRFLDAA